MAEVLYDEFGIEIRNASQPGKPFAKLEDETRLTVIINGIYVIGDEDIRQPNGSIKTRFAVGVQYDSLRALRYEDGTETGRTHSWFNAITFSYHDKSTMVVSGLAAALGIPKDKTLLTDFIKMGLGKQVSARVKHRKYTLDGVERIATDLEAFKPAPQTEDFKEVIAKFIPHRQAVKRYPGCKFCFAALPPNVKAPILSEYVAKIVPIPAPAPTGPVEIK